MPIIEKVIVIYNNYNFRKTLQLVIIIIIITIFAKVIHNCNAYILNVITTSLINSLSISAVLLGFGTDFLVINSVN